MNLKLKLKTLKDNLNKYRKNLANNPKKRWTFTIILFAIILAIIIYANLNLFIVAIVNGSPISRISLIKELEKQGGKQILDSIVTKKLIFQEAKKNNVNVSAEDIDNEIKKIEDQLKDQGTTLDTALAFQGQTREELKENLKIKLVVEKLISNKINVTEEEISKYFNDNKSTFEKNAKLEDVKSQILEVLTQQKLSEAYQKWLTELKSKAKINLLVNF